MFGFLSSVFGDRVSTRRQPKRSNDNFAEDFLGLDGLFGAQVSNRVSPVFPPIAQSDRENGFDPQDEPSGLPSFPPNNDSQVASPPIEPLGTQTFFARDAVAPELPQTVRTFMPGVLAEPPKIPTTGFRISPMPTDRIEVAPNARLPAVPSIPVRPAQANLSQGSIEVGDAGRRPASEIRGAGDGDIEDDDQPTNDPRMALATNQPEALKALAVELDRTFEDRLKQVHAMSRSEIQAFRQDIALARMGGLSSEKAARARSVITSIAMEGITVRNIKLFPKEKIGQHIKQLRRRSHGVGVAGVATNSLGTALGLLSIGGGGAADEFQKQLELWGREGDQEAETVVDRITRVPPIEKPEHILAFERKFETFLKKVPDADTASRIALRQDIANDLSSGRISRAEAGALNRRLRRMTEGIDAQDARFFSNAKLGEAISRFKKTSKTLGVVGLAPIPVISNILSAQSIAAAKNAEGLLAELQHRSDGGDTEARRMFRSFTRILKN